ncbi:MAG: carbon-nitrogen hydrolase family protein [Nevskia sp.]
MSGVLRVAAAQLAPVWLDRAATLEKVSAAIAEAADHGARLVAFGETLVPGYPFWIERTDGARFNSAVQKAIHAHYAGQAVTIEAGHLDAVCALAKARGIAVYLGVLERGADRSGHSVYCSLVYIGADGLIGSVHRKLVPTYEERLSWAPGDGHGLRTHRLGAFTLGGLNCWENWMPLTRAALYAQGEDLHVAVWPGNRRNTVDLTRHIARESRSFVISVSGLMRREDFPESAPHRERILAGCEPVLADGGTCICGPDGEWLVEPVTGIETIVYADLDPVRVREERQNFDPAGHYARPDVTQLTVNRDRQTTTRFLDPD